MSEPKNTPGPWTSSLMNQHSEYPPIILISGGDGNIVCEISDICVNDADLSFMLAAPDMYEALEEVWRILDSTMPLSRDNRADRIKRILCKARGEENERA